MTTPSTLHAQAHVCLQISRLYPYSCACPCTTSVARASLHVCAAPLHGTTVICYDRLSLVSSPRCNADALHAWTTAFASLATDCIVLWAGLGFGRGSDNKGLGFVPNRDLYGLYHCRRLVGISLLPVSRAVTTMLEPLSACRCRDGVPFWYSYLAIAGLWTIAVHRRGLLNGPCARRDQKPTVSW